MEIIDGKPHTTIEDYWPLKKAHDKAKEEGKEQFVYEGTEILTKYAYYLLQYIEINISKEQLERFKKGD